MFVKTYFGFPSAKRIKVFFIWASFYKGKQIIEIIRKWKTPETWIEIFRKQWPLKSESALLTAFLQWRSHFSLPSATSILKNHTSDAASIPTFSLIVLPIRSIVSFTITQKLKCHGHIQHFNIFYLVHFILNYFDFNSKNNML